MQAKKDQKCVNIFFFVRKKKSEERLKQKDSDSIETSGIDEFQDFSMLNFNTLKFCFIFD